MSFHLTLLLWFAPNCPVRMTPVKRTREYSYCSMVNGCVLSLNKEGYNSCMCVWSLVVRQGVQVETFTLGVGMKPALPRTSPCCSVWCTKPVLYYRRLTWSQYSYITPGTGTRLTRLSTSNPHKYHITIFLTLYKSSLLDACYVSELSTHLNLYFTQITKPYLPIPTHEVLEVTPVSLPLTSKLI